MRRFLYLKLVVIWMLMLIMSTYAQDTLRIVTYNLLKFSDNVDTERLDAYYNVLSDIEPDILVTQELINEAGAEMFLTSALNKYRTAYSRAQFYNGPDTDNSLFYKSDRLELVSQRQIPTALRDISEYVLRLKGADEAGEFRVFSMHLKASSGSSDQAKRLAEVQILRDQLNQLAAGSPFFVCGDFNIYRADEAAFCHLTRHQPDNRGCCYDPLEQSGKWHDNTIYSGIHTQSTHKVQGGGYASGGLDDRFDFVLISEALLDQSGFYCLPETYQSFGNDGRQFNQAINFMTNSLVTPQIVAALYVASDHLPVGLDFVYSPSASGIAENSTVLPPLFQLHANYPNPFNLTTQVSCTLEREMDITWTLYDNLGREVKVLSNGYFPAGEYHFQVDFSGLRSGVYFMRLAAENTVQTQKMLLLK